MVRRFRTEEGIPRSDILEPSFWSMNEPPVQYAEQHLLQSLIADLLDYSWLWTSPTRRWMGQECRGWSPEPKEVKEKQKHWPFAEDKGGGWGKAAAVSNLVRHDKSHNTWGLLQKSVAPGKRVSWWDSIYLKNLENNLWHHKIFERVFIGVGRIQEGYSGFVDVTMIWLAFCDT